ncbi:MAG: hypothetical protein ACKOGH_20380 [Alphaproteobacteria bacterium]
MPKTINRAIAATVSIVATTAVLVADARAQQAQGQPLAQAMVGTWAVGGADKCASAPYRVTLDNGAIVFKDRGGKVTRELIEAEGPATMVTRVVEAQPGKQGAAWNYERRTTDTIAVTNTTTRRTFTIFRCAEPAVANGSQGDFRVGYLTGEKEVYDDIGGCAYYLLSDDRKPNRKMIAGCHAGDLDHLVLNIDGHDVVATPTRPLPFDKKGPMAYGTEAGHAIVYEITRVVGCGWECHKVYARLDVSRDGVKKTISMVTAGGM